MLWKLKAYYYGKKDGKIGLPQKDDPEPAIFEKRVCAAADNSIEKIHRNWGSKDSLLSAKYNMLKESLKRAYEDYNRTKTKLGRDTTINSMTFYRIEQYVIGLAEAAATYLVFRIFGENLLMTMFMTISIMIGLPLAGHFCGKFLKQGIKNVRENFLFSFSILIVVSFLAVVAILRSRYVDAINNQDHIISHNTMTIAFIALNLVLFIVSIVASYFVHDTDPDIYKFKRRYEKTQKRFQKTRAKRDSWKCNKEGEAKAVAEAAKSIIMLYRDHNLRKRMKLGNKEKPISFNNNPIIDTPSFEFEKESYDHLDLGSEPKIYKISEQTKGIINEPNRSSKKEVIPF